MLEIKPKFIHAGAGAELVVLTRAEFDDIMTRLAEAEEEADDVAAYDAARAELALKPNPLLPAEVSALVLNGDHLLRALRKWRGLTQATLASMSGIAQGYLSELESGRRIGSPELHERLAAALDVDPKWLARLEGDRRPQ